MHPSTKAILRFFDYEHLDGRRREVAQDCAGLAETMAHDLADTPHGAELTTGLRKLLEAKDCFVRCTLPAESGK